MPTTSFLNREGDTTIEWTPDVDEKMMNFFDKKLKEGMTFFIVDNSAQSKPIKSVFDIGPDRKIVVKDADLDQVLQDTAGKVTVKKRDKGETVTKGIARTAADIVKNDTVAVQPQKGG